MNKKESLEIELALYDARLQVVVERITLYEASANVDPIELNSLEEEYSELFDSYAAIEFELNKLNEGETDDE